MTDRQQRLHKLGNALRAAALKLERQRPRLERAERISRFEAAHDRLRELWGLKPMIRWLGETRTPTP